MVLSQPVQLHLYALVRFSASMTFLRSLFTATMTTQALRQPQIPPTWPYTASDFTRSDSSPDGQFYANARFVEHIDDRCIAALTDYYGSVLPKPSPDSTILDLASSWISHLPKSYSPESSRVIGVGMNKKELAANPALSSYQVRDLNENPSFDAIEGLTKESVDAVVCSVSIDYLSQPRKIMGEIARVLKTGGSAHMTFSNRCFPTKVVNRWLHISEPERCNQVAIYFAFAGDEDTTSPSNLFKEIEIVTVLEPSWSGDPLYVVRGKKA